MTAAAADSASAAGLVRDHIEQIRAAAQTGGVLDLACGRGRNALFLAKAGVSVLGMDRNPDHLRELQEHAQQLDDAPLAIRCDLETRHGIPVAPSTCGAILVFRFLFRPLAPAIERALQPGGILLYETFVLAGRRQGLGPRRREFYLQPDELPGLFPSLEVISYREGPDTSDPPYVTAQLVARRPD